MSISYVSSQSCSGQLNSATGVNPFTFTSSASNITAGSFLCVLACGIDSGGNSFSWAVTDNASNTYTAQSTNNADGETGCWAAFTCASTTGNPTTFHLATAGGANIAWAGLLIDVFTGVDTGATIVKTESTQNAPGTGTDAITSGNLTPSKAGIIWGGLAYSFGTAASGTGETTAQTASSIFIEMFSEYKTCGTSAIASTWSDSTNGASASAYADTIALAIPALVSSTTYVPFSRRTIYIPRTVVLRH